METPLFYGCVEFASARVLREEGRLRSKCGFSLKNKDVYYEFKFISDEGAPPNLRKTVLSTWMKALNNWVVRREDLKKFTVINEIGRGGQAKVYKISKNRCINGVKNAEISAENTFAIKIIKKDPLVKGPKEDIE